MSDSEDWEYEVLGGFPPPLQFTQVCYSGMQYYMKTPKVGMTKTKPVHKYPETTKSINNSSGQIRYQKYILTNLIS